VSLGRVVFSRKGCAKHVSLGRVVFSRKGCAKHVSLGRVVVAIAKEARVPWKGCCCHCKRSTCPLEGLFFQGLLRSFLVRVVVAIAKEARVPWKGCAKHVSLGRVVRSTCPLEGLFFQGRVVRSTCPLEGLFFQGRRYQRCFAFLKAPKGLLLPLQKKHVSLEVFTSSGNIAVQRSACPFEEAVKIDGFSN